MPELNRLHGIDSEKNRSKKFKQHFRVTCVLFGFFSNLLARGICSIILKVSLVSVQTLAKQLTRRKPVKTKPTRDLRIRQQSERRDNEAFTQTSGAAHGWSGGM
jgi:hypothetical protein